MKTYNIISEGNPLGEIPRTLELIFEIYDKFYDLKMVFRFL